MGMVDRRTTMSRTPSLAFVLRAAVVAALTAGCIDIPEASTRPRLATYVDDWRNEIIYQVLVDRFANGDVNNDFHVQPGPLARYQGGDWKGLEDHLDYIRELGVTTLWISPVVRNVDTDADVDAYHGYWAQDLTALNPHFGDLAALRSLTDRVHDLGMKIVEDVVVNHLGQVFFYDINMNGKPDVYVSGTGSTSPVMRSTEFDPDFDLRGVQAQTPLGIAGRAPVIFVRDPAISREPPKPGILGQARAYHGLGRITNFDDETQARYGDFPGGLKDLATEVTEVRQALTEAYLHWVEEANFDGLRLDTIKHVEHEFWKAFSPEVRERMRQKNKTKFILFGEALDGRDAAGRARLGLLLLAALSRFSRRVRHRRRSEAAKAGRGHRHLVERKGRPLRHVAAGKRHRGSPHQGARQLHRQPRSPALSLRFELRRRSPAQRAHVPLRGGGHSLRLLRNRARFLRRQRSCQS
jgi:alpha-amylase